MQAAATGTSSIDGQVVTDEAAPRPVGRAIVDCVSNELSTGRSDLTDDDGRFACRDLPAGRYLVSARKAAFVTVTHGASRPGRPGIAISLTADQRSTITLRLPRGAVVTGVIKDRDGRPAMGVRVSVTNTRTIDRGPTPSPAGSAVTDDTGSYRVYGLPAGQYVISAQPRVIGNGSIGAPSVAEMDATLAQIAARARSLSSGVTPASTPSRIPDSRPIGFAPWYYPGTAVAADAAVVSLNSGEERGGIDFDIAPVRASIIEGRVSGPLQNLAVTEISVLPSAPGWFQATETNPILSVRPTANDGTFKYTNVTPGHYTITARADRQKTTPDPVIQSGGVSMSSGPGPVLASGPTGDFVFAVAEVDVSGNDVLGVDLTLQPPSVLAGRLVFESSTAQPPTNLTGIRVGLTLPGPSMSMNSSGTLLGNRLNSVPAVQSRPDGTFAISGIGPGTYLVQAQLPSELSRTWVLKSAAIDLRDYLDQPLQVQPGRAFSELVVTLTDRRAELSGTLQSSGGVPAPDYFIVAFTTDRALWRPRARRIQSTRPASDGAFVVKDLPAGEYFLAALTDVEPADLEDAGFLEQLVPAAVKITLADGEKKRQDLRIAGR